MSGKTAAEKKIIKGLRAGILLAAALGILLLLYQPVFAYEGGNTADNPELSVQNPMLSSDTETDAEISDNGENQTEEDASSGTLTPAGNLTLLDDVGTDQGENSGQQFFTVESKEGNVFYLIIDRQGEKQNVYFLNKVDEQDLLSLTKDGSGTENGETAVPADSGEVEALKEELGKVQKELEGIKQNDGDRGGSISPAFLLVPVLLAAVAAAFFLLMLRRKKEEDELQPDPDEGVEDGSYFSAEDDIDYEELLSDIEEELPEEDEPREKQKEEGNEE